MPYTEELDISSFDHVSCDFVMVALAYRWVFFSAF